MSDRRDLFDDIFGLPDDDMPGLPRHTGGRYTASRHPMPCPPLGILMAYLDESDTSITPRRRARIGEHVRYCEACQMDVRRGFAEVLHGVHEILKDAHDVNQAALRRRESRFQHELKAQKKQPTPLGSPDPLRHWFSIAATLALIVMGVLLLRPAAVVIQAEELIERAIAYQRQHAAGSRQRVRESLSAGMFATGSTGPGVPRIDPFSRIRDVFEGSVVAETRLGSLGTRDREAYEADEALARLFEKHHFDWRKPLCLSCYHAWRSSLTRKRDTVTLTGDMVVLRTTTSEGALRAVTLAFDRDSYRVVRQRFEFQGLGRIDVEELEHHQSVPANQRASAASSRAVVDDGTGTLAPSVASRPPAANDVRRTRTASPRVPLSRWLDRTFLPTSSAAASAFLSDVQGRSSAVRQHLIALQRLASITDSEKLKNGPEADRDRVRQQVELEYQAVTTHLRALEERLSLLLGSGNRVSDFRTPLPADWQQRASTALPHATRLEYRLRRIFTHDDLPPEETQPSRPRSARAVFEALWESIHGNQREDGQIPR